MASPVKYQDSRRVTKTERDEHGGPEAGPWQRLLAMTVLSFASMYVLMYAMVYQWPHVLGNYNQVYMAGLMTAPMVVIELALMGHMLSPPALRAAVAGVALVAAVLFWFAIRDQMAIGNAQFLRSMIPHHSGAILMCRNSRLTDPEIIALCKQITDSQQREIDTMQAILRRISG
ncbi:MAG TPA: DUF305 domain-containing protein [Hyphomicrobiaceae bacterium]|nr:DUF305 domain-containing protein [Hyphomicrobiaceae bacterium]